MHIQFAPNFSNGQVCSPSFTPCPVSVSGGTFSVWNPPSDLVSFLVDTESAYSALKVHLFPASDNSRHIRVLVEGVHELYVYP